MIIKNRFSLTNSCHTEFLYIGHEIGHSFQYQVSADKLFTGEVQTMDTGVVPAGFRYGFGENGVGGCAYWEQCAQ